MSETDKTLEEQIETLSSEESIDESEVESDAEADDSQEDSAQEEEEEASEEDSDDSKEDSETESEVEFDFHNTSTSIQKLVSNLKDLSPEERNERISKLTREKEIEAVKKAFPDVIKEDAPVSRSELDALTKKFEELSKLAKPEELQKALEIASKLNATESMTDGRLKDLMLQEQFGDSYKEVTKDPKFITAYEKYPKLSIEERLEIACSLSPIAKKLATETEVQKQVRLQNTKTVSKGKQITDTNKMKVEDVKNLDDLGKLMETIT